MKILQINACCTGSTGRTCVELAEELEKRGHECFIAYAAGPDKWKYSYKIGTTLEQKFHALMSRLVGLQGYFSCFATLRLLRYIKRVQPDIIHLRNLHANYIHLPILFRFLRKGRYPVVVTLHDCWPFTGKCTHYTARQCYRWQAECGRCPALKQDNASYFFDFSARMLRNKKRWYEGCSKFMVTAVSDWVKNEGKQSPLFNSALGIERIYNWIDLKNFVYTESDWRQKLGIPQKSMVVLTVSAGWQNNSKTSDLKELAEKLPEDMYLVTVGNIASGITLPPRVIHINYVEGSKKLAQLYSMADVYVHISEEDTFGKVIAESMSCGTPAIVYDATACPELVEPGCGYIVEKHNVDQIVAAIKRIACDGRQVYAERCRQNVCERFDKSKNISAYIALYEQLLA